MLETDRRLLPRRRRVDEEIELVLHPGDAAVDLGDTPRKIFIAGHHLTDLNEYAHDENVHVRGAIAAQDRREHGHALFGEYPR